MFLKTNCLPSCNNLPSKNLFCEFFIIFLICSHVLGETIKIKDDDFRGKNPEDANTAIQVLNLKPQQLVTRTPTTRIVRRRRVYYTPAKKKYPKGAVYSKYKMPQFYVTYKCPRKVGLFLCRRSCERRSPNVIGSCDNGYCICLLLTPGFRGRGVFSRRANCSLQSHRVRCNKYCKYRFGSKTFGACRGRICRCFTNPVTPGNKLSACAEAERKLKMLDARLKLILRKSSSSRTPADMRLIQEVSRQSSKLKPPSSRKVSLTKSSPRSRRPSKTKQSPKKEPLLPARKTKPVEISDDSDDEDEDEKDQVDPSTEKILTEKAKESILGNKSPQKGILPKTPRPPPKDTGPLEKDNDADDDDDDDKDDDEEEGDENAYKQVLETGPQGILKPGGTKLDTPLVDLIPGPKNNQEEEEDEYAGMTREREDGQKGGTGVQDDMDQRENPWLRKYEQLEDYGQTRDPRKTRPEMPLKDEGACPLKYKQEEDKDPLDDVPEVVDTWYEDHFQKLPPTRNTQNERASQKATDQLLNNPEYEGLFTHYDNEYRYGRELPTEKFERNAQLYDFYRL